jgi:sigma-B regulation protein RsbU (phosphoserine phosphatase)
MAPRTDRPQLTDELKYRLLLEIAQKIRGTLDLDEILSRLLDSVAALVRFDAAGIYVLRSSLLRARDALPEQVIAGIARRGFDALPPGRDPMLLRGEGITGHVARTGETVLLSDVSADPRYVIGRHSTRSEVAVPLLRDGRAIGALNLESDRPGAFDDADVEVLRFFAEAATIALDKAILHERILEGERVETQLRIAQEVQRRLLPAAAPEVPGHAIAGLCRPTFRIGGDYYDYIALPDGRLALVVADVAGKGIPAALVMSAFRALLRAHAESGRTPLGIAQALNAALPESLAGAAFVTAFVARLDPATGVLEYVNCGHNPPFVVRARGGDEVEWLDRGGLPLGIFPARGYEAGEVRLGPGDVLTLYTDGVVESADQARRDFGAERLATVVGRLRNLPPSELLREIVRLTREFSGAVEFDDDYTLVVLRREA